MARKVERKFLGFNFTARGAKRRIAAKALARLKTRCGSLRVEHGVSV